MNSISLPQADQPRASIIILAWRSSAYLLRCLQTVADNAGGLTPYEVILALNEPGAELTALVRQQVRGARVESSRVNLGFGGGCSLGAAVARGEFLVFLNDDAEVEPGWLDALVTTAEAHPEAGAIGSRVLFPDGRLQEAGSVIWNEGGTYAVGGDRTPEDRAYMYLREVDYCSGCSLLVRRTVWDALGGFDDRYFPAYYEDADLCMGIRGLGYSVLYQPRSVVRHHRSVSTVSSYRAFLFERNRERFRAKWSAELQNRLSPINHWPSAEDRAVHLARGRPHRLLLIDDFLPTPGVGSGLPRMYDTVRELAAHRFAVTVACSGSPPGVQAKARALLEDAGIEVLDGPLLAHLRRAGVLYEIVLISRPNNFETYAQSVRQWQPQAVLVYDSEALYHRRLERQVPLIPDPEESARIAALARSMKALEERIAREADQVICISEDEAAVMASVAGHSPVHVLKPLVAGARLTPAGFADRCDIAFVAGWAGGAASPNGDALAWFVREVLPLVRQRLPDARLRVTGGNVPDELRAYESAAVTFTGFVDDLYSLYGGVRVAIAPTRYGAGVKIKTVEALQYGVPAVATSVGAEGIDAGSSAALTVADDPAGFADAVVRLLASPDAWLAARQAIVQLNERWAPSNNAWSSLLFTFLTRSAHDTVALHR